MVCEWCLVDSCRTHAKQECCLIRRLAKMPNAQLMQYAKKWTTGEKDYYRPLIVKEKLRLKEIRR